jgi:hypothetical protein
MAEVSVVLVLVVTEVRCACLFLVPAIRRHRCPTELEREQSKQNDGEKSTHGAESSGYGFLRCFQGRQSVGFHH